MTTVIALSDSFNFKCSGYLPTNGPFVTAAHCYDKDTRWNSWDVVGLEHSNRRDVKMGEPLTVVGWGCYRGKYMEAKTGIVFKIDGQYATVTAPICFGDSGGPAFNDSGKIVGIVKAREIDTRFAVIQLF